MSDRYFNPFQAIDINVPVEIHEALIRYSQRETKPVIDQSPFPRMVDMWFFAACLGARRGLKPADLSSGETRKIIDGSIFGSDPWRIHTLMLIAIYYARAVDVVSEPRRVMAIVSGLAVSGFPLLLDMLSDGDGDPIWNLSEAVEALLRSNPNRESTPA